MKKAITIIACLGLVSALFLSAGEKETTSKKECAQCDIAKKVSKDCASCDSKKVALKDGAACELSKKVALKDGAACELSKKGSSVYYTVKGLSCESCSSSLTKTLTSLDGVSKNAVCHKSGTATINFDSKKVSKKQILAAINTTKFKVTGEKAQFAVKGMTCAGCSSSLTKTLTSLKGVQANEVCHVSGKAVVTFDPTKLDSTKLIAAINSTGFKAEASSLVETPAAAEEK
jgi:copper ion binding protein